MMDSIVDSLDLGSAKGGRRQAEVLFGEIIRPLSREDIPLLENPPPLPLEERRERTRKLGYQHHQLARILAQGRSQEEACAITGFSQSFVSIMIKEDRPFRELLAYYAANEEAIFVDVAERLKTLAISTIEELQERINEEPDGWSKKELMTLLETATKGLASNGRFNLGFSPGGAGQSGVNIGITFVQPPAADKGPGEISDEVIDVVGVDLSDV